MRRLSIAARGIVGLALLLAAPSVPARGQFLQQPGQFVSGMQYPRIPPEGDWLEVMTVTNNWIVLQNARGQQFPVALKSVELFLMRWPTSLQEIPLGTVAEVTGVEVSNNQILATEMDVFSGPEQRFVTPAYNKLVGFNRIMTAFDVEMMNIYGLGVPLLPGEQNIPLRLHVAGPIGSLIPLRIAIGANNSVVVMPGFGGMAIYQVTAGTPQLVRPGDMAYIVLGNFTPSTLELGQLVVFKAMSRSQFVP
jgi:hypothetical protein